MSLTNLPVVIGGIGGSGTRLVAQIFEKNNYFLGANLNASYDNLDFSSLFPELRTLLQTYGRQDMVVKAHINSVLQNIRKRIIFDLYKLGYPRWGWKVPTSFFILESLKLHFPTMCYIHVIRHGLDMAFSSNHNQLHNWGFFFNIDSSKEPLEKRLLSYWIRSNEFAISECQRLFGKRYFIFNYDRFCQQPIHELHRLSDFIGFELHGEEVVNYDLTSSSIGRYRARDCSVFNSNQLNMVNKLGFPVFPKEQ